MSKDFEEILSKHANELESELGVNNIFIGYIDDKGDAHGNIHGDAITADNGGDIKLANVIKDISDRGNISKDEIALILRSRGMANVADEYLRQQSE